MEPTGRFRRSTDTGGIHASGCIEFKACLMALGALGISRNLSWVGIASLRPAQSPFSRRPSELSATPQVAHRSCNLCVNRASDWPLAVPSIAKTAQAHHASLDRKDLLRRGPFGMVGLVTHSSPRAGRSRLFRGFPDTRLSLGRLHGRGLFHNSFR